MKPGDREVTGPHGRADGHEVPEILQNQPVEA